jgi:hypothetical protein
MLLKISKSKSTINYLLPPLAGITFWLQGIIKPNPFKFFTGEAENLLYQPFNKLTENNLLIRSISALALVVILSYLIQHINNHYNFIRQRSILPALIFIIIISGFPEIHTLHPVYFASLFFVFAIFRLFSAFEKSKPYSAAFDTGVLMGVASLFYFNIFFIVPSMILGLSILSPEKRWREFALLVTGLLLPFFFAFTYTYFTGQSLGLLKIFELNIMTSNNHIKGNIPLQFYITYLIFLTFLGSIKILKQYDHEKISTRKYFMILFLLFVNSITVLLLIPGSSSEILIISAIPLSYLMSNFFLSLKSRFWGELLYFIMFADVITLQLLM